MDWLSSTPDTHSQLIDRSFLVLHLCCSVVIKQAFHPELDILDLNQVRSVVCVVEGSDVNGRLFGAEMVTVRKR